MIPVICFVGAADCGKTTLLEKVIFVLKKRGYNVGVIKNDTHGFDVDKEGKDTYRLKNAKAHSVLISGPDKFALISDCDKFLSLDDFVFLMGDKVDIVLTEGFKSSDKPKIELFLDGVSTELLCAKDNGLIGVATNNFQKVETLTDKRLFDLNNETEIADFIENHYIKKKKSLKYQIDQSIYFSLITILISFGSSQSFSSEIIPFIVDTTISSTKSLTFTFFPFTTKKSFLFFFFI